MKEDLNQIPAQVLPTQGNYGDQLRSILENPELSKKQRATLIKELDVAFGVSKPTGESVDGTTKPVTSNATPSTSTTEKWWR